MDKHEFFKLARDIGKSFPGAVPKDDEVLTAWHRSVADIPAERLQQAASALERETEYLRPGSNLGAILRNRCSPAVTQAVVEANLYRSLELSRRPDGDQYAYLRGISPRLLEMAESADLFSRDMTSEAAGFRVRDIARQFCDERENVKKGFVRNEPLPASRQIAGPSEKGIDWEEQQRTNREGIKTFKEQLNKMKGERR